MFCKPHVEGKRSYFAFVAFLLVLQNRHDVSYIIITFVRHRMTQLRAPVSERSELRKLLCLATTTAIRMYTVFGVVALLAQTESEKNFHVVSGSRKVWFLLLASKMNYEKSATIDRLCTYKQPGATSPTGEPETFY